MSNGENLYARYLAIDIGIPQADGITCYGWPVNPSDILPIWNVRDRYDQLVQQITYYLLVDQTTNIQSAPSRSSGPPVRALLTSYIILRYIINLMKYA